MEIKNVVGGLCGACAVNAAHTTFDVGANAPNPNAGVFLYVGMDRWALQILR